jgi:hypothetical protein
MNYNKPIPQFSENKNNNYNINPRNQTNYLPTSFNKTNTLTPGFIQCNQYEKPNTLYDNLTPVLMNREVIEYPIVVDGADRDINIFPDPYSFRVALNSVNGLQAPYIQKDFENIKFIKLVSCTTPRHYRLTKTEGEYNSDITANVTTYLDTNFSVNIGNVYPVSSINNIINNFKNEVIVTGNTINYLTLNVEGYISNGSKEEYVHNFYKTYSTNSEYINGNILVKGFQIDYIVNQNINRVYLHDTIQTIKNSYIERDNFYDLHSERYLVLNMEEMRNINQFSTSNDMRKSFAVLFPNKCNRDFVYFYTDGIEKFFKNSELQNLKNMTFSLVDSTGNKIQNPLINFGMPNPNRDYTIPYNKNTGFINIDYTSPDRYIRHPYFKDLQITLLFKIGIYENDIDKNIFCYNK